MEETWLLAESSCGIPFLHVHRQLGSLGLCLDSKKKGGAALNPSFMKEFDDCIDACGLEDLMLAGSSSSWSNSSVGPSLIECNLDRCLVAQIFILLKITALGLL